LFWRDEYQDGEGNLSHIHGLARAVVGSEEELRVLRDKIRGFNADIVRVEEVPDFVERQIFDKHDDWYEMSEEARTILTHRTERNKKRTGTGDDDVTSRTVDPVYLTPDPTQHVEVRIDPGHKPEVVEILARCGLCNVPPVDDPSRFEGEHELLRCTRHFPPVRAGEQNMSPVHGAIFAAMRSMSNVQIVSGYTIARYVTKYLIKQDKNSHTVCRVSPHDESRVMAKHTFLYNTKIAVSNANEMKRIKGNKRENQHPQGRVVARPEIVQILIGDPQVHHNMEFVKVATTPLEDRVGFKKISDLDTKEADDEVVLDNYRSLAGDNSICFVVYPDYVRRAAGLPEWRQFTANQLLIINDNFDSEVTVSNATIFDVRPPELRELFPCLLSYFRWFERVKIHSTKNEDELALVVKMEVRDSWWIDGFGYTVRVRRNAFVEVRRWIAGAGANLLRQPNAEILSLFIDVLSGDTNADWPALKTRFVSLDNPTHRTWARCRGLLPVPVHSFVKPTNATKFLFHILLSLGQYETSLDLVSHATMRNAFEYANLVHVDEANPEVLMESVTDLVALYIVQQLAFYPVGTRTWGNYLLAADKAFKDAIINGEIPISELPACLYSDLLGEVDKKVKKRIDALRDATLRAAYKELRGSIALLDNAPTLAQLLSGQRIFSGELTISEGQSLASFEEQENVRKLLRDSLAEYSDPTRTMMAKSVMIAGGPGNGKTHCLMYATLLFYAQGRIIVPCAVLADRARAIGGEHFHMLFCFPTCLATAQRLAELAVINILRRPESVELLLRIDALALDESGTLSAAIFSALDIIMRRIRGSSTWMGGMLIITTIDDKQLKPVKGYPMLLSPHILTCFRVAILRQSVRSSDDINQQRVIEISRMSERVLNAELPLVDEVVELVSSHCTFVDSWDDPVINEKTLRVFPKKTPVFDAVEEFYAKIEADFAAGNSSHSVLRWRNAEDVQNAVESHGHYQAASPGVSAMLDKDTKEARRLLFFPYAVFVFTYNDPGRTFTQSRLAIMYDVPCQSDIDAFRPIYLYAAPPGVRVAPEGFLTREELVELGWTRVRVTTAPDRKQTYVRYGVRAKRKQYGLRPFISATIHCVQGATLFALATSIEIHKRDHRLWEKAQWLVLISRTRRLKDVIFVGDKQKTLDMIRRVLLIRSQFSEYTDRVLTVAAGETADAVRLTHATHPYRSRDKKLPYNSVGFCYLLVSAQTWLKTYIGQTEDLLRRIREHNSGQGARETRGKGPWLLVAYVTGFGTDETARRQFEDDWQNAARFGTADARAHGMMPSITTTMDAAEDLIHSVREGHSHRAYSHLDLRLEQHADLTLNV
jgi:predicted GIY-YIG superfamily endonuclease